MTATITTAQAEAIIEASVSDWDHSVLRDAAIFAIKGGSAYDFEGRPHDAQEMHSFAKAFAKIQSA